jgi:2-polyprenyl-3-methyl-5-hydroxy-6-metoxy-1,4-benzoquinol methylase
MNLREKIVYFADSARKNLNSSYAVCPSCGSNESQTVDTKMMVTRLARCERCGLQFRVPITTDRENSRFYQRVYSQGFTTAMPGEDELAALMAASFRGTEKDYSVYLAVLEALGCHPGDTLLDFGCSWGYGSWQLLQAGYRVKAVEISVPRCAYARDRLGIEACESPSAIRGPFDVFFSAHVLEHVPSVQETIAYARKMLRPGGLFIAFTPNGSEAFRKTDPWTWHRLWGHVHPQFLDERFYRKAFPDAPLLLTSSPYDFARMRDWAGAGAVTFGLEGAELLVAVRV